MQAQLLKAKSAKSSIEAEVDCLKQMVNGLEEKLSSKRKKK